jgi:exoribonuclease R
MVDNGGQQFDSVVFAVTSFGLLVELSEPSVEGLMHISSLSCFRLIL